MEFRKYQHLERFGTPEVQNIELGECYVFPKIDGTNASVWLHDGEIKAGSRNRQLSLESDNAGFYEWVMQQDNIREYLLANPAHRLYGEWLVPHSLKTYRDSAWRNFYVFDVCVDEGDEIRHLSYHYYKPLLEQHNVNYIPPISVISNGSYEQFMNQLAKNVFLIKDGAGAGEGVVIKRYDFFNKYGRQTWAKIVTSEFKEKHAKTMGGDKITGQKLLEEEIANKYVTSALVDKEFSKIEVESGWNSRMIPRLLNTVYYSVVKEECWNFIKENKNPVLDFKKLQHYVFALTKTKKPELFN